MRNQMKYLYLCKLAFLVPKIYVKNIKFQSQLKSRNMHTILKEVWQQLPLDCQIRLAEDINSLLPALDLFGDLIPITFILRSTTLY